MSRPKLVGRVALVLRDKSIKELSVIDRAGRCGLGRPPRTYGASRHALRDLSRPLMEAGILTAAEVRRLLWRVAPTAGAPAKVLGTVAPRPGSRGFSISATGPAHEHQSQASCGRGGGD